MRKILLGLTLILVFTMCGCYPDTTGFPETNADVHNESLRNIGTSQILIEYIDEQMEEQSQKVLIVLGDDGAVQVNDDLYIEPYRYQFMNDGYHRYLDTDIPAIAEDFISPFLNFFQDEIDLDNLAKDAEKKYSILVLGTEIPFYEYLFEEFGITIEDNTDSYARIEMTYNTELGYFTDISIDFTCLMDEDYVNSFFGLYVINIEISEYMGLFGPAPTYQLEIPETYIIED